MRISAVEPHDFRLLRKDWNVEMKSMVTLSVAEDAPDYLKSSEDGEAAALFKSMLRSWLYDDFHDWSWDRMTAVSTQLITGGYLDQQTTEKF